MVSAKRCPVTDTPDSSATLVADSAPRRPTTEQWKGRRKHCSTKALNERCAGQSGDIASVCDRPPATRTILQTIPSSKCVDVMAVIVVGHETVPHKASKARHIKIKGRNCAEISSRALRETNTVAREKSTRTPCVKDLCRNNKRTTGAENTQNHDYQQVLTVVDKMSLTLCSSHCRVPRFTITTHRVPARKPQCCHAPTKAVFLALTERSVLSLLHSQWRTNFTHTCAQVFTKRNL